MAMPRPPLAPLFILPLPHALQTKFVALGHFFTILGRGVGDLVQAVQAVFGVVL